MYIRRYISRFWHSLAVLCLAAMTVACSDSDDDIEVAQAEEEDTVAAQAIIMFYPYCGNLLSAFNNNVADMATVALDDGYLSDNRIVVYICQSAAKAYLIEITDDGGKVVMDTVATETFSSPPYADAEGMASLVERMQAIAPAESYAMIVGCHGMGWLPAGATVSGTSAAKGTSASAGLDLETRYFGHSSDAEWQCDISVLADGITATGTQMDYILFDACYMANVEVAYELRNATRYLIASPAEIMAAGVPYGEAGTYLLDMDLDAFCDAFADYYLATTTPYATIAAIDCSLVEDMAEIMSEVYATAADEVSASNLQTFDGISPHVFYDFGNYVRALCDDDATLLARFEDALDALVPYSRHTPSFYSAYSKSIASIKTYSGLTVSAPSSNSAAADWAQTAWAMATLYGE